MKITTERLIQIIKEEVDAYAIQEKLEGEEKDKKKTLDKKGKGRTKAEDKKLKQLKHK
jgi:hypothetical protein